MRLIHSNINAEPIKVSKKTERQQKIDAFELEWTLKNNDRVRRQRAKQTGTN
jgi:hypothetical protein